MRKMRPIQRDDVVASYLTVSSNNPVNSTINNNKEEEQNIFMCNIENCGLNMYITLKSLCTIKK